MKADKPLEHGGVAGMLGSLLLSPFPFLGLVLGCVLPLSAIPMLTVHAGVATGLHGVRGV